MQVEYIKRINAVLKFIDDNLSEELSLQKISEVANYSPFHLHRLCKAVTNETLNNYIIRRRLEKIAIILKHNSLDSIADIASKYGFKNDSSFSRLFKKTYGQSPYRFRKEYFDKFRKIGKVNSKIGKEEFSTEEYLCNVSEHRSWFKLNAKIEIKDLPKMNMAYLTHIGVDKFETVFLQIIKWATPRGLFHNPDAFLCRIFHDSFKVTDSDKIRMSIGILCEQDVKVEGKVAKLTIEKGRYIVGQLTIEPIEMAKSWESLFIWMHENGYTKAEGNPMEIYRNKSTRQDDEKLIVDLLIPIKHAERQENR
jgi:AraC family transcriptional regulator